ncbi:MAG: hypothetical protein ACRETQ_03370 [Gammaproteobacteria bacterium]
MLKFTLRWAVRCSVLGILLATFGCSSSSNSYTLLANLAAMGPTQRIVMAAIDVTGSSCKVSVLTADSASLWQPSCSVNQSSATHKSFTIDGQQVVMDGANGSFKVSNSPSLTLPVVTHSVATAAINAAEGTTAVTPAKPAAGNAKKAAPAKSAKAKEKKAGKAGEKAMTASAAPAAASAAAPVPATGQAFPDKWVQSPYPGQWDLAAQNLGYLVQSATANIDGSQCKIDVVFKVKYPPYHFNCIATSDASHNFTLIFNPYIVAQKALSPTSQIVFASEGQSITGVVWDSHGFDAWNPAVPPSWRVAQKK